MNALPMFPLGAVLFPSMVLPLHVFEPRYRALVDDCVDGDGEFGVVLIEAMAAGTTVVASGLDGYRNVATHGRDALLSEPGDAGVAPALCFCQEL